MNIKRFLFTLSAIGLFLCPTALGILGVDITPLGTAYQTTDHATGLYLAENAVDGDINTFSHCHYLAPNSAWWLEFSDPQSVIAIEIVMRIGCCGGSLNGSILRLLDMDWENVFSIPVVDNGDGMTFTAHVPLGTMAKIVWIGFENGVAANLHIAEVRVYTPLDPPIISFEAIPSSISSGQSAVLSWNVTNATSVEILGFGPLGLTGQMTVTPSTSTPYILIAEGQHGETEDIVTVQVDSFTLPPLITEFMAYPDDPPDWIEIWNPDNQSLNLTGWHLTDNPNEPALWTFPSVVIPAGDFVVLGAGAPFEESGLATNFALAREENSYLALTNQQGIPVCEYIYPKQVDDVSYGKKLDSSNMYFLEPTPGKVNQGDTTLGFLESTQCSVERGFYQSPFSVTILSPTLNATVYYTTNNSMPGPNNPDSIIYAAPVAVNKTTVLRAVAYLPDYMISLPETHTYIFLDDVVNQPDHPEGFPINWLPTGATGLLAAIPAPSDYGMDPDIVSASPFIDNEGQPFTVKDALLDIPTFCLSLPIEQMWDPIDGLHANARLRGEEWERFVCLEIIEPITGQTFHTGCGLRIHGGRGRFEEVLKKSFRLYFRGEYGAKKLKYPIFENMPSKGLDHLILRGGTGETWDNPWAERTGRCNTLPSTTYLRDQFLRDSQRDMGSPYISGAMCHLYINGLYWGLYNYVERPGGDWAANNFGGDEDDYDVIRWAAQAKNALSGDSLAWNQLMDYGRENPADMTTFANIESLLNIEQFIGHLLLNFFVGNYDWVRNNAYVFRHRSSEGRFQQICWDGEEIFSDPNMNSTEYDNVNTFMELFHNLRANTEFRQLFGDMAQKHILNEGGALSQAKVQARHDKLQALIDRAIVAESARWGDSLIQPDNLLYNDAKYPDPDYDEPPYTPYTREVDWIGEMDHLATNYFAKRGDLVISQLKNYDLYPSISPPVFVSQRGGWITSDYELELGLPDSHSGIIYFTLDGTDPRMRGGEVADTALEYPTGNQINFAGDTKIRTRLLNNGQWSALDEAYFYMGNLVDDLVITEVMYHPVNPTVAEFAAGFNDDDYFEYIVIYNYGQMSHRLDDLQFSAGIDFNFDDAWIQTIDPNQYVIIVHNAAAFDMRYGLGLPVAGQWQTDTKLDNGGEEITLAWRNTHIVDTFIYDDTAPWPTRPDGDGDSLMLINPELHPDPTNPLNWRTSRRMGEMNDSETIDIADLALFAECWSLPWQAGWPCSNADFDSNDTIDIHDLAYLMENWLQISCLSLINNCSQ